MVEIIINRDKVLDGLPPSQDIALNFAEAKFNSIVGRGGSFSNKIKFAKTNNNIKHLGSLDDVQGFDLLPYQRLDAEIKQEGLHNE